MNGKIIYVKYSNERAQEFSICTQIVKKNDYRFVRKKILSSAALDHIRKLQKNETWMNQQFKDTNIYANKITKINKDSIDFEYIDSESLETIINKNISIGKIENVFCIINDFFYELEKSSQNEFIKTKDFITIFGDIDCNGKTMKFSNIDMSFQNLFKRNEAYIIIDYEWCFDFPIPVKFIKWRILHLLTTTANMKSLAQNYDIYARYGINVDEQKKYSTMQNNFYLYVKKDFCPLRFFVKDKRSIDY